MYTMGYYLATKNETLPFERTSTSLEDIVNNKHFRFTLTREHKKN